MRQFALNVLILLILAGLPLRARAQDADPACVALLDDAITAVFDRCAAVEGATACAASGEVALEADDGPLDSPAPLADLAVLDAQPVDGGWSVARFHIPDPNIRDQYAVAMVFGPARLDFDQQSDLAPGAAFALRTTPDANGCDNLPVPGVLVQAPDKYLTLLRVNGVDLAVNGTALIQSSDGDSTAISAITRETIMGDTGVVVFAGYGVTVEDGAIGPVQPFDPARVANLPTVILPRMDRVPAPGSAAVREETVLHLRPEASAYTGTKVRVGLPVNALGIDSSTGWLYIRTYDGLTGWVPRSALDEDLSPDLPVFDTAPAPLARPFGPVYARGVTTSQTNNLRAGPGQHTDIVTQLPAGTALAVYGRNPDADWLLVETEDGTRAWISAALFEPGTPFVREELPVPPDLPE